MSSRGARGNSRLVYEENFTFSVELGATVSVTVATLGNRPPRSNFRPIRAVVTAATAYVPATQSHPGFYVPASLQFVYRAPGEGDYIGTSNLMVLGANPVTITQRYPSTGAWWPYNNTPSESIMDISAVCMGRAGNSEPAYIRGVVHLYVALQPEVIVSTCPQHIGPVVTETTSNPEGDETRRHEGGRPTLLSIAGPSSE